MRCVLFAHRKSHSLTLQDHFTAGYYFKWTLCPFSTCSLLHPYPPVSPLTPPRVSLTPAEVCRTDRIFPSRCVAAAYKSSKNKEWKWKADLNDEHKRPPFFSIFEQNFHSQLTALVSSSRKTHISSQWVRINSVIQLSWSISPHMTHMLWAEAVCVQASTPGLFRGSCVCVCQVGSLWSGFWFRLSCGGWGPFFFF